MSERRWHSGPPPYIGWWHASAGRLDDIFRWWDGSNWSCPARPSMSMEEAAYWAKCKDRYVSIEWTTYWPKNARVPRIKP